MKAANEYIIDCITGYKEISDSEGSPNAYSINSPEEAFIAVEDNLFLLMSVPGYLMMLME